MLMALGIVLLPGEKFGALFLGHKGNAALYLGNTLFRVVGAVAAVLWICDLGFSLFRGRGKGALFALPFLIVAIDNLPIVSLCRGTATLTASGGTVALFAVHCIAVGVFEELVFRGLIFPLVLRRAAPTKKGILCAVLLSSALFGAVHLVNLFSSSPVAVLMQVGYSFLVGCMCAVVLLLTRNVFACAGLHALYNFCGMLISDLGYGVVWDGASIALTAVVATLGAAYGVFCLCKILRPTDGQALCGASPSAPPPDVLDEQEND